MALNFNLCIHMDEHSPGCPSLEAFRYFISNLPPSSPPPQETECNSRINLAFILDVNNIDIAHQSCGHRLAPIILFYFPLQLSESLYTKFQSSHMNVLNWSYFFSFYVFNLFSFPMNICRANFSWKYFCGVSDKNNHKTL